MIAFATEQLTLEPVQDDTPIPLAALPLYRTHTADEWRAIVVAARLFRAALLAPVYRGPRAMDVLDRAAPGQPKRAESLAKAARYLAYERYPEIRP